MPFKSKAQRRKFYALKSEGKMDQKTIDEWEKDTPKKLPEKIAMDNFWNGFTKQASAAGVHFTGGDAAELAGLGALVVPSVSHLMGHDMSENTKAGLEVGGLGTLAAPYIYKGVKALRRA
jgi:hypothetical protein